ncbi:Uncharacterized protein FWK35_00028528 [Aphis craccivora]|uniref:Uncharacterized protein n=1 Tax=Aphis craccivora TaxID=307492 RepID=A0A6G0YV76_APHCR|nr:Uncharacterized protein FWK35_00028528 [Aphis craccivora]
MKLPSYQIGVSESMEMQYISIHTENDISSWHKTSSKFTKIEYHSYSSYTTSFNNNEEIRTYINPENVIFIHRKTSEAEKYKFIIMVVVSRDYFFGGITPNNFRWVYN